MVRFLELEWVIKPFAQYKMMANDTRDPVLVTAYDRQIDYSDGFIVQLTWIYSNNIAKDESVQNNTWP